VALPAGIGITNRMGKLDEQLEKHESREIGSDRWMFSRAMIWAAVALLVILVAAVFLARPAARKVEPVTPNTPRSELQVVYNQGFA